MINSTLVHILNKFLYTTYRNCLVKDADYSGFELPNSDCLMSCTKFVLNTRS